MMIVAGIGVVAYFFISKKSSATQPGKIDPTTGLQEGYKFSDTGQVEYDLSKNWIPNPKFDLARPMILVDDATYAAWLAAHPPQMEGAGSSTGSSVIDTAKTTQEYLRKKFLFLL